MSAIIAFTFCTRAESEEIKLEDIPPQYILYAWECEKTFDVSAVLLLSLCYTESRFKESTVKGNITQITNTKWFKEGIEFVGAENVKDNPQENMMVCAYYINKWANEYEGEVYLWLMMWNMGYENAKNVYNPNKPSRYAKEIVERADKWTEEWEKMQGSIKP